MHLSSSSAKSQPKESQYVKRYNKSTKFFFLEIFRNSTLMLTLKTLTKVFLGCQYFRFSIMKPKKLSNVL